MLCFHGKEDVMSAFDQGTDLQRCQHGPKKPKRSDFLGHSGWPY